MIYALSLLAVLLSLLLVVGVHELGHAWVAYYFKINIKTISIGFGKPLYRFKDNAGRHWVWALWPLGGYVHLLNSRIEPLQEKDYPFAFDKKPVWVRCMVLLSGSLANLFVAWLALVLMLMLGFQQTSPLIEHVKPASIASETGLKAGDQFVGIADHQVMSWHDVGMQLIIALGGDRLNVEVVSHSGLSRHLQLDLKQWHYEPDKGSLLETLGIEPDISPKTRHIVAGLSVLPACQQAFMQLMGLLCFFMMVLKQLLTGHLPFGLLIGPFGALSLMIHSFFQGVSVFLYFIANLSLAVALINVLPIPGLDGGSMVYAVIEKIQGKPISIAMEILLHRLIMILFFVILVQLLLSDLKRLI